jgi:hypothetical protein
MGELPPYTDREIARELDRSVFKGFRTYENRVEIVLEKNGIAYEFEIFVHPVGDSFVGTFEIGRYIRERR